MFLIDVWPKAKVAIYCEFYYGSKLAAINFDPESPTHHLQKELIRLSLWNLKNVLHFDISTAGISSTQFQADTFSQPFWDKISVLHDGIDTVFVRPHPQVKLQVSEDFTFNRDDEVISLFNRNLEPYRGCHTFFWVLPQIFKTVPMRT